MCIHMALWLLWYPLLCHWRQSDPKSFLLDFFFALLLVNISARAWRQQVFFKGDVIFYYNCYVVVLNCISIKILKMPSWYIISVFLEVFLSSRHLRPFDNQRNKAWSQKVRKTSKASCQLWSTILLFEEKIPRGKRQTLLAFFSQQFARLAFKVCT